MAPRKTTKKFLVNDMISSMFQAAEKEFGRKGIYVAGDHAAFVDGVDLVYPALQWLLDSNVLPLGRIMMNSGDKQSCKSAFSFFFSNLFLNSCGAAFLIDTESKTSPSLLRMMVDNPKYLSKDKGRYHYISTGSMEEWMSALNILIDAAARETDDGKNRTPILITVDSMAGSESEATAKQVEKDGAPKAGFGGAKDASIIKTEMQHISSRLTGLPVFVMITNHRKKDPSDPHGWAERTPGGRAPGLHITYEFVFKALMRLNKGPDPCGFFVDIKNVKNSMGPAFRELQVPFHWDLHQQSDEYGRRRRAYFDWDWSLSNLLVELQAIPEFRELFPVEIQTVKSNPLNNRICYEPLTGSDSFVPYSEFGKAFREDTGMSSTFKNYFDIQQYPAVRGEEDEEVEDVGGADKEKVE